MAQGVPTAVAQAVLQAETVEAGLQLLRQDNKARATAVFKAIATRIDSRAAIYVKAHTGSSLPVGCMLFDRRRQIIATSSLGHHLFEQVLVH
jgi:cobalt-precorrin-5B (C1)-methyltransferase